MANAPKRPEIETTLAYMAVGVIAISILSILATLVVALLQLGTIAPIIVQLPLIGLPVGFILIMALLIVSVVRRRKENRE